jgi:hypothetical protein
VGVHRTLAPDDKDDVTGLTVDVLGMAVAIGAPPPLLTELRVGLADLACVDRGPDRELTLAPDDRALDLRDNGRMVRRGVDLTVAVATVVWRLNAIAAGSTEHVLLHAACVAGTGGDRAVVLPGGSGAGKTTLTSACLAAGLTYLSDEVAAVDRRTGRVAPYAKPLGLAREGLVPASSLGPVATGPTSPAAIVFPRYQPGATTTQVPLDTGWALLALAAHASNVSALGGCALAWLAGLSLACPASQLTYGDASEAVAAIERAAAGPARSVEPAEVLAPLSDTTTTVAVGDALAVLHEPTGKIHLLNASAAAVWRRAAGAATDGDGDLDRSMAAATVDQLVQAGLLAEPAGA